MSTRTVPRGTDTSRRVRRVRTLKVRPVSLELDETAGDFLVYVEPTIEGRVLGISPHRARLPKCSCEYGPTDGWGDRRCRMCRGWDYYSIAGYVRKLLRTYPTIQMPAVPEPVYRTFPVTA